MTSSVPLSKSYSITLVTSLAHTDPLFLSIPRKESNTSEDFLDFVYSVIASGALLEGDVFIVDNASVHWAIKTADELSALLDAAHVRLVFTPTYSPEVNPCEFVFAQVKRSLRERTDWENGTFEQNVLRAFTIVTYDNVYNYYDSCINSRAN